MQDISIKDIDSYLAAVPQGMKLVLEKLRHTIKLAAPEAEEVISYGMPAFKYHGMLVYFAAFKNHCSFFPASGLLIKELAAELAVYKTSKGTIQFTIENPLPTALVKKMVKMRVKQNLEKEKARKATLKK